MPEQINHPAHYGGEDHPYETIKVLKAWLTPEQMDGFLIGNVMKYLSRAGKKNEDISLDFGKALWYLSYLIDIKKEQPNADSSS